MKKKLVSNLYTNLPCFYTVCLSPHIDSEFHSKHCALYKGIHDYSFLSASCCTNFYIDSLLVELPNRKTFDNEGGIETNASKVQVISTYRGIHDGSNFTQ